MATGTRKRLLLVAATTGYQTKVFAEVGRRLGVDVSLATDRCHVLNDPWGDQAIPVRFEVLEESAAALAQGRNFDAVVAVGDTDVNFGCHCGSASRLTPSVRTFAGEWGLHERGALRCETTAVRLWARNARPDRLFIVAICGDAAFFTCWCAEPE